MGFLKTVWGLATSKEERKCLRNLNRATTYIILKQQYELAIEPLNQVLNSDVAADNQRCKALNFLGQIYVWKKDFGKAKDYLEKALDLSIKVKSRRSDLYDFLGYVYCRTGDYAKALQFYRLACQYEKRSLLNRLYMKNFSTVGKNLPFLEKHEDLLPFMTAYYQQNRHKFEAPKESE